MTKSLQATDHSELEKLKEEKEKLQLELNDFKKVAESRHVLSLNAQALKDKEIKSKNEEIEKLKLEIKQQKKPKEEVKPINVQPQVSYHQELS